MTPQPDIFEASTALLETAAAREGVALSALHASGPRVVVICADPVVASVMDGTGAVRFTARGPDVPLSLVHAVQAFVAAGIQAMPEDARHMLGLALQDGRGVMSVLVELDAGHAIASLSSTKAQRPVPVSLFTCNRPAEVRH